MMFSFELFLLNAKKINLVWLSVIFFYPSAHYLSPVSTGAFIVFI